MKLLQMLQISHRGAHLDNQLVSLERTPTGSGMPKTRRALLLVR